MTWQNEIARHDSNSQTDGHVKINIDQFTCEKHTVNSPSVKIISLSVHVLKINIDQFTCRNHTVNNPSVKIIS
jgi:hypothetical protein